MTNFVAASNKFQSLVGVRMRVAWVCVPILVVCCGLLFTLIDTQR